MGDHKESETRKFLKKRAPFYLAGITILAVFVVPGMLEKNLTDMIPDTLSVEEREVLNRMLQYDGGDGSGIDMKDALTDKIKLSYADENIFEHGTTAMHVEVLNTSIDTYRILLEFEARGELLSFDWSLDQMGVIQGNNDLSKDIVDSVNFYD